MLQGSSGIKEIETDTFKLHCHQTLTGVKFVVVADRTQVGNIMESLFYSLYFSRLVWISCWIRSTSYMPTLLSRILSTL